MKKILILISLTSGCSVEHQNDSLVLNDFKRLIDKSYDKNITQKTGAKTPEDGRPYPVEVEVYSCSDKVTIVSVKTFSLDNSSRKQLIHTTVEVIDNLSSNPVVLTKIDTQVKNNNPREPYEYIISKYNASTMALRK